MRVRAIVISVAIAGVVLAGDSGSSAGSAARFAGSAAGASAGARTGSGSAAGPDGPAAARAGGGRGAPGQLTGAQLTAALLPARDFPAAFAASQQGSSDSGSSLEKSAATYSPSTISCTDWDNYFTSPGFGETAFTTGTVTDRSSGQSYGQVVYQFRGASAAARFFSDVQSLPGRCRSFTAGGGGSPDRVTMRRAMAPSVDGHQAFWLDQRTTVVGASSQINTLFAVDGTDVIAISASGLGSAPPSSPAPPALLRKLIASLHAPR